MNFPKCLKVQGAHLPRMMRNAYIPTEVKSVMDESVIWMVCVSRPFHTIVVHFPFSLRMWCVPASFLLLPILPPLKLHLKHFFEVFHTWQHIVPWFGYSNMLEHWFHMLQNVEYRTCRSFGQLSTYFSWTSFFVLSDGMYMGGVSSFPLGAAGCGNPRSSA